MGVGYSYVAPSADLVRGQGLAVIGCGLGLIRVGALAGLGGFDSCGLGFAAVGRSGARWRARWRPSAWFAWCLLGEAWLGALRRWLAG